jgi:hypothetical protein
VKHFIRLACLGVIFSILPALSGCAFANRYNRPVWNAFELSMVPESNAAFYASLPLTVPIGLGAILIDTFIAHPIAVADNAWDDTRDLWRGIEMEEHYYTECAWIPVRIAWSPVVLVGSFLGRSMFDLPSNETIAERRELELKNRRDRALTWLNSIAAGEHVMPLESFEVELDDEYASALLAALTSGTAHGRILIYKAVGVRDDPSVVNWVDALGDPSAVVRYQVIDSMPRTLEIPDEVLSRLLADPDQAVRERAQRRFVL